MKTSIYFWVDTVRDRPHSEGSETLAAPRSTRDVMCKSNAFRSIRKCRLRCATDNVVDYAIE
jgi:hypothetical protein